MNHVVDKRIGDSTTGEHVRCERVLPMHDHEAEYRGDGDYRNNCCSQKACVGSGSAVRELILESRHTVHVSQFSDSEALCVWFVGPELDDLPSKRRQLESAWIGQRELACTAVIADESSRHGDIELDPYLP